MCRNRGQERPRVLRSWKKVCNGEISCAKERHGGANDEVGKEIHAAVPYVAWRARDELTRSMIRSKDRQMCQTGTRRTAQIGHGDLSGTAVFPENSLARDVCFLKVATGCHYVWEIPNESKSIDRFLPPDEAREESKRCYTRYFKKRPLLNFLKVKMQKRWCNELILLKKF